MLKFINNFEGIPLTQALGSGASGDLGTLYIDPASASLLADLLGTDGKHQVSLTLYDKTSKEIVYAVAANASTGAVQAYRGQDGTGALDWSIGTSVASRLTHETMTALPVLSAAMICTGSGDVLTGADGQVLVDTTIPTYFGQGDPYGLTPPASAPVGP